MPEKAVASGHKIFETQESRKVAPGSLDGRDPDTAEENDVIW
ncbi:hypothetical protein [Mycetocola zhadangensis]|nr:hypothetical protein [Mycetocola zhadangensis]